MYVRQLYQGDRCRRKKAPVELFFVAILCCDSNKARSRRPFFSARRNCFFVCAFLFCAAICRAIPPPDRARRTPCAKAFRKAHIKKDMVSAVHSNGAWTVFSFPRKMRLQPTLCFDTRLAVHDLTRHRANLRALFPSAFAARCHPPQRGGQDKRSFLCSVYSKIHIFQ